MKSLYLAIIFLPIICGCKSKTSQSDITDKTRQKVSVNAQDTLRNFVSNIYKHNFMKTKSRSFRFAVFVIGILFLGKGI